jgi:hypothetical protein
VDVIIFMYFYLESLISLEDISQWIRQTNRITFCTNIAKSATETWYWLDRHLGKKARSVHGMFKMAVPQIRRLVAGFPLRLPGLEPGSRHVGFAVNKAALVHAFFQYFRFL